MSKKATILSVDDSQDVREMIKACLEKDGYEVLSAANGTEMFGALKCHQPDLILLDLTLEEENGIDLMRQVQEQNTVPVIILSAHGEDVDRIIGLESGADDYVAKPFVPRELSARIQAVLRRGVKQNKDEATAGEPQKKITFDHWTLDRKQNQAISQDGRSAELESEEFKILEFLVLNPQRGWNSEQLQELLNGSEPKSAGQSIDTQIANISKKLGDDPKDPKYIKKVPDIGYTFCGEIKGK